MSSTNGGDAPAVDMPVSGLMANTELMAKMQSGLWAGGALIAMLVAVLPHPHQTFALGFVGVSLVSALIAALLRKFAHRMSPLQLQVLGFAGTALITLSVFFTGESKGAPATDIEMLYFWIAIYAAYFFSRRQATAQIGFAALSYWVVLALSSSPDTFAIRWAETAGTLAVAGLLVQALRNRVEELVHRLTDAARTDPLTGLQNRRAFEEIFKAELERSKRSNRQLSVLVGDLDHFKLVNDQFGHPAGDAALVKVGQLLRSSRREIDPVARTGGEEFALILPETSGQDGYVVAERLRAAVEGAFTEENVALTMSIGIASYPDDGDDVDGLMAAADQALYAAKELGRNRAVVFSDEVSLISPSGGGKSEPGKGHLATMISLAEALDQRDTGTADHSQTVGRYCALIARELDIDEPRVERIQIAGLLHDIGKIGLPDSILRKAGTLSDAERAQVRRHPELGAEIVRSEEFADIRAWIVAHHERPDGKGYPAGLSGEQIPLESRILAVADSYEAMTSDRPYRVAIAKQSARAELLRCAGTQFDPRVVAAFLAALDRETERLAAQPAA
jgi:diguanylate cyclase (GGDEF)-like protein/putative nucleotidyltransferase with HDIG domain